MGVFLRVGLFSGDYSSCTLALHFSIFSLVVTFLIFSLTNIGLLTRPGTKFADFSMFPHSYVMCVWHAYATEFHLPQSNQEATHCKNTNLYQNICFIVLCYLGLCVPTCSKHTLFEKGYGYSNILMMKVIFGHVNSLLQMYFSTR